MKKCKRCILTMLLWIGSMYPIYAAPVPEGLFPASTGMGAKVVGTRINIRSYPALDAKVVEQTDALDVKVIGKNNDWYKVIYDNQEGWVYGEYVEVERPELIPYAKVKGEEVVAYGVQFIGTPYVWGGNDLDQGVDCSGFTKGVYDAFDIAISRVSYMQAEEGRDISKDNLRVGDLVFFDTQGVNDGNVSHVGIYMGDDKFIHSDSTKGVMISTLNSNYYTRNYVKAVRIC